MRRMRHVKILATLGPASRNPETISRLFAAGADAFRINMSHMSRRELSEYVAAIRDVEKTFGRPIGILVDLQGPKLRIGTFIGDAAQLLPGAQFVLDTDPSPGDDTRVCFAYPEVLASFEPGQTILLDDGKIRVVVESMALEKITVRVLVGGRLSNRKGVSVPETIVPIPAMTEKDRADLDAALELGIDWVALSFVQRAEDVAEARKAARGRAFVMAKIEKPQAVSQLGSIIEAADALMVARGDLGMEMPLEKVPGIQKQIIHAARRAGKAVVVATQMLESMIVAPVPTRAEVSDVGTAVFEGADAVMLSAESAAGQFPVEAVATMNRIGEAIECDLSYRKLIDAQRSQPEGTGADAIAAAARGMAETLDLRTIVAWSASGATGRRLARERPQTTILALTPSESTARRLSLFWGVHAVVTEDARDVEDMVRRGCRHAQAGGFANPGERVIVVAGVPFGTPGATNMVRLAFVDAERGAESSLGPVS